MRQARYLRGGLVILALSGIGSTGCIQNYYPVCAPNMVHPGTQVSEVPADGTVTTTRSSAVGSPPQSVVSQPRSSRLFGSWNSTPAQPSSVAETIVEGGISDPTTTTK